MDSNWVYGILLEAFPQVDARLLKAAAIEHSKDPDEAIEFILAEVISSTKRRFNTSNSGNLNIALPVETQKQCFPACNSTSEQESTSADESASGLKNMKDTVYCNEAVHHHLDSTLFDAKAIDDQTSGKARTSAWTMLKSCEETGHKVIQNLSIHDISVSPASVQIHDGHGDQDSENSGFGGTYALQKPKKLDSQTATCSALSASAILADHISNVNVERQSANFDSDFSALSIDSDAVVPTESLKTQPRCYGDSLYGSNYVELAPLSLKEHSPETLDCSIQSNVQSGSSIIEDSEFSCKPEAALKDDTHAPRDLNTEGYPSAQSIVAQFGQVCNTDLLENIIEESKNHKKKLLSDMESVLKLMMDVEHHEKVARQAKEEALRNGPVLHANLDELKSTLDRARENNDKYSGEVHGEKAILAAEMRELQSQLHALSSLKEESLAILDEMRKGLEARLTAVKMERLAAEQEKYQKEESFQRALAEQELVQEKVTQESVILLQEAEENVKLREFLVDCGRMVDTLQGEISVICQDVKLLKDKFDNRYSVGRSPSTSVTAEASSESEQAFEFAKSSSIELTLPPLAAQATHGQKEILEEGWELFEAV